jgi:hypothetical protein
MGRFAAELDREREEEDCNYRSAAGRRDDHGNDRNGDCALVRIYVCVHRERHARTVRQCLGLH